MPKPDRSYGDLSLPVSGGRNRDRELLARSEHDGDLWCAQNCKPDAMMSRDGRNASATEQKQKNGNLLRLISTPGYLLWAYRNSNALVAN